MKTKKYRQPNMKPGLVLNHAPSIQKLTTNLLPALCRHETLEGRNYIAVPMVMLTEGVHNGSNGPLYYPKDELEKTPVVWNHKPIVVYHPTMNGVGISACDPIIIESRKVGLMMNTKFENGRLKSEAWIEADRANKVDPRIMEAIEQKKMMELSTGVFTDNEDVTGDWNGEAYIGIARNYRPDHLALLPDQIGACSIKDGAGLLRNAERAQGNAVLGIIHRALQRAGLADNELSFSNTREALQGLLRKKFNAMQLDTGPFLYVEDVYSNFVVYDLGGKLFRIGYTSSDTGVTLSDETPVEVKRVTEYRTVEGAFVGNQDQVGKQQNKNTMEKNKMVDAIITGNSGWSEADRENLMALTDNQLATIHKGIAAAAPTQNKETKAPAKEKETETKAPVGSTTTNADRHSDPKAPANVITVDGYIENAPKEIQEVLRNGLSSFQEEKARLIEKITANETNPFTPEDLESMPIGQLKKIAQLATVPAAPAAPQAHFGGQAPVPSANSAVEEPLVAPVINFTK